MRSIVMKYFYACDAHVSSNNTVAYKVIQEIPTKKTRTYYRTAMKLKLYKSEIAR